MKLWVARDKDGGLFLYDYEPHKNETLGRFTCSTKPNGEWSEEYELNSQLHPEVTFENSPQEIELKLCYQTETVKITDCNPKSQPCVLTNRGIDTNVIKFD